MGSPVEILWGGQPSSLRDERNCEKSGISLATESTARILECCSMSNGRIGAVRAFVFDLDGTLIDSKMDLVNSVNAMLRDTNRAGRRAQFIWGYVGAGYPQSLAGRL